GIAGRSLCIMDVLQLSRTLVEWRVAFGRMRRCGIAGGEDQVAVGVPGQRAAVVRSALPGDAYGEEDALGGQIETGAANDSKPGEAKVELVVRAGRAVIEVNLVVVGEVGVQRDANETGAARLIHIELVHRSGLTGLRVPDGEQS